MTHRRHRLKARHALALTLSALVSIGTPAGALAQSRRPDATRAALAAERYYSSYRAPATHPDAERAALATEHYLSSYGIPQPLAPPTTPTTTTPATGRPSWTIAILGAVLLIAAAASIGVLAGRASIRPRRSTA
jgi:hypothetical protein